jgi:hypothetical protein
MTMPRTAFSQGRFYSVSTVERQLPSVRVAHRSATISAEGVEEHSHDDAPAGRQFGNWISASNGLPWRRACSGAVSA